MPEAPDVALEELYREVILDHYKHPRNRGRVEAPGATEVELQNPTCGDEIRLSLELRDGRIADLRFEGRGCSISMASASMMTEACRGLSPEQATRLYAGFKALLGGRGAGEGLGDLEALGGVAQFPVRVKCATLAWNALLRALGAAEPDGAEAGDGR
jgi:nitrogen fixation NifU-like protein